MYPRKSQPFSRNLSICSSNQNGWKLTLMAKSHWSPKTGLQIVAKQMQLIGHRRRQFMHQNIFKKFQFLSGTHQIRFLHCQNCTTTQKTKLNTNKWKRPQMNWFWRNWIKQKKIQAWTKLYLFTQVHKESHADDFLLSCTKQHHIEEPTRTICPSFCWKMDWTNLNAKSHKKPLALPQRLSKMRTTDKMHVFRDLNWIITRSLLMAW